MPPAEFRRSAKPLSGRYLSLAEREEIALLLVQGHGVCEIARRLGRAPSTISREIRRNAATRSGNFEYRATTAQWHAERAARRPKVAKLVANDTLRRWVEDRLSGAVANPVMRPSPAPWYRGTGGDMGLGRTGAGQRHGARSRLQAVCTSTFRTTTGCASVTRPFTSAVCARSRSAAPRP